MAARREPGQRQHGQNPRRNAHGPGPSGRRPAQAAPPAAPIPAAAPAPAGRPGSPGRRPGPGPVRRPGQPRGHHQPGHAQPGQAPGQLGDVVLHPPTGSQATQAGVRSRGSNTEHKRSTPSMPSMPVQPARRPGQATAPQPPTRPLISILPASQAAGGDHPEPADMYRAAVSAPSTARKTESAVADARTELGYLA